MANYLFEQMSDQDAANYTAATDSLFFLTGSASTVQVKFNPATGLQVDSLTLTNGSTTHTFSADALGGESLTFFSNSSDQSTLAFGFNSGASANDTATVSGVAGSSARYFGLGGSDIITGSLASDSIYGGEGNDTITAVHGTSAASLANEADLLTGGNGADTITGTIGNDHIYGNTNDSTAGATDGGDSIDAGGGNDYVNGNAGDDSILGNDGNDRLYGGAGNDTILGGNDHDYIQGNKGADSLSGGNDSDELHGGADNDTLHGDAGNDAIFGDLGNDTIFGDAGYDKLTGGAGNDLFSFAAGDANNANASTALTAASHGVTDQILDFTDGQDTIAIGGLTVGYIAHTGAGVTFTDVSAAQVYAEQLLDAHTQATGTEVAAIQVGADTYLFYNSLGGDVTGVAPATSIDSVIKVVGVSDTVFNTTGSNIDFV